LIRRRIAFEWRVPERRQGVIAEMIGSQTSLKVVT
jgi:hypothetical protein